MRAICGDAQERYIRPEVLVYQMATLLKSSEGSRNESHLHRSPPLKKEGSRRMLDDGRVDDLPICSQCTEWKMGMTPLHENIGKFRYGRTMITKLLTNKLVIQLGQSLQDLPSR